MRLLRGGKLVAIASLCAFSLGVAAAVPPPCLAGEDGATADNPDMGEAAAIHRGAPLKPGDEVALSALLGDPQSFQGRAVRTSGIVSQVCQNRGCWMELTPRDGGRGIRVTFKDYAFFVPRDAKSAAATCEGEVVVETLSAADAEHLKSEGATVATDENGAAREVRFVATGVELTRAKNL